MKLLLDTHIAIWAVTEHEKLPPRAFDLLLEPENESHVSVVSIWEIAIKNALRRGDADPNLIPAREALTEFEAAGFGILPVLASHACSVEQLANHHRDPFDRLLVAQAISEPMYLLTCDEKLAQYSDFVLRV